MGFGDVEFFEGGSEFFNEENFDGGVGNIAGREIQIGNIEFFF